MTAAYENGQYVCYDLVAGRRRHYLGCQHDRPRQAIAHTSGSYVSPLRAFDEASTAAPGSPLLGGGSGSDASSESLSGDSGPKR